MADSYNPDVLTCLASLSNEEVFTPPAIANQILDMLPASIWQNSHITFIDPVSKSGVFLREIVRRLDQGLLTQIPEKQKRINHILVHQVFGIAITELTALLSRRSVYCSKAANSKYSICSAFNDAHGNLRFKPTTHHWTDGRCTYCGANQDLSDRGEDFESHAYEFIHTENPQEIFNMRFDVIVGNPPYQISDGGAKASAAPIYHKFVQQAMKLSPRYLSMIIPSRWFAGGKGLDDFRAQMLADRRISRLIDFPDAKDCFPGIDLSGGVSYFLWERDRPPHAKDCEVTTVISGRPQTMKRPLQLAGVDTFIRYNQAIAILHKVFEKQEDSFSKLISARQPFGLSTHAKGEEHPFEGAVKMYGSTGTTYIHINEILVNKDWATRHKVFIGRAYGERISNQYWVTGKPFLGAPNTCCTETYMVVGPFASRQQCERVMAYMRTRFFRFLVLLKKNTQDATQKVYELVPVQDFTCTWTDQALYNKYGISSEEQKFIEAMVRPMESDNG